MKGLALPEKQERDMINPIELNEIELNEVAGGMTCAQANATADVLQTIAVNIGNTPGPQNAGLAAWYGGLATGWRQGGCA
jgi:hypothetical protein